MDMERKVDIMVMAMERKVGITGMAMESTMMRGWVMRESMMMGVVHTITLPTGILPQRKAILFRQLNHTTLLMQSLPIDR